MEPRTIGQELKPPTPHELQVLQAVVERDCVKQAALALGLSPHTVKNHLARLRRKSGHSTVMQIWHWAQAVAPTALPKGESQRPTHETEAVMQSPNADWSGVTDAQWARIEPVFPMSGNPGRHRIAYRGVVNGLLFKLRTGCSWELIPRQFCTRSTGNRYCQEWNANGVWILIWRAFYSSLSEEERHEWAVLMLESGWIPQLMVR